MKKIMFNDRYGLTEAVLSGRKTQTRRIIPQSVVKKASEYQLKYFEATLDAISEREAIEQIYFVERLANLPYQVDEVVAVAQCYKDIACGALWDYLKEAYRTEPAKLAGWTNKLFVRADLMLHRICITNVRVERLQDISDEDCIKEGVELNNRQFEYNGQKFYCVRGLGHWRGIGCDNFNTPREAYAALIDRISGKGTWESNPWVFVYDF